EGKRFGRPPTLNDEQKKVVIERIQSGVSISAIAREFNTTRQTILRVKQIDILPRLKAEDSYSVQTEA
ncbi:TPA: helix-turn-helix domain-containing protein, partial [Providencia alcalifaciens]